MSGTFYTVEIPLESPAEVCEWPSKQHAVIAYLNQWWCMEGEWWSVEAGEHYPTTETDIFDRIASVLHAFRAFDSTDALHQWAAGYRGHQWITVRAQAEEMLEEVQS